MKDTAHITTKGQITLPKLVRDRLGLRRGDAVRFVEDGRGYRIERAEAVSPFDKYVGDLEELRGVDVDQLIDDMRGR